MNEQAQLLARYRRLRQVGMKVNNTLVARLSKDMLDEGGRKLGILRKGVLVLDSEDEMSVLMDFCIHDVRRHGRNAAEQFLAETPYPPGSDEAVYLESLPDAYYSLFLFEAREPGVGVQLRDLVRDESRRIIDVGMSQSAEPGFVIATRLIAPDNIAMTGGAGLPLGVLPKHSPADALLQLVETAKSLLSRAATPEETSEVTAALIHSCLQAGAASHIAYTEPGKAPRSIPAQLGPPTVLSGPPRPTDRYALCPCGSGKKFKFCCGARR